LHIELLN